MRNTHTILILIGSIREGRNSLRVAKYFERFIAENQLASVAVVDLKAVSFPLFEERLQYLSNPPANLIAYQKQVQTADAVILISPEYNGGYPAAIKNALDVLYDEWQRKPVGLATVSSGSFGGSKVGTQLQSVLLSIGAAPITTTFPVPRAQASFDEHGTPTDQAAIDKRAAKFIKDLLWQVEALRRMQT